MNFCQMMIQLLIVLLIPVVKGGHPDGLVYVDEENGSGDTSCGSISLPCKSLQQAVNKCPAGGKVTVEGDQFVTSVISINNDLSIIGRKGATIRGNTTNIFVFSIKQPIRFSLFGVTFRDIAVATLNSAVAVDIVKCSVIHTFGSTQHIRVKKEEAKRYDSSVVDGRYYSLIELSSNAKGAILTVVNSTFSSLETIAVFFASTIRFVPPSSIRFGTCIFDNAGIDLNYAENLAFFANNCTFRKSRIAIRRGKGSTFLTIRNCIFNNISDGAIRVHAAHPIVKIYDTKFEKCISTQQRKPGGTKLSDGGAISVTGTKTKKFSLVAIERCLFEGNVKSSNGGDLSMQYVRNAMIKHCTFRKSRVANRKGAKEFFSGGSIMIIQGNITIISSTFTNCTAEEKGGAITIYDRFISPSNKTSSQPVPKLLAVLINCTFKGNKAGKEGGAIAMEGSGSVQIQSCTFEANSANLGGGIAVKSFEKDTKRVGLMIKNSRFLNNHANDTGGGINVERGKEFMKNRASSECYSVLIDHCEFVNNSATVSGQSLYVKDHIQMNFTSVSSIEKVDVHHLFLEDGDIELNNLTVTLFRDRKYSLPEQSPGVEFKSKEIRLSSGFTFTCPNNFRLIVLNKTQMVSVTNPDESVQIRTVYTYLNIDCISCPFGSYSLDKSRYHVQKLPSTKEDPGSRFVYIHNVECLPCPTGAICDKHLRAVDNYWGYADASSRLFFQLCPTGYCCGPDTVPCGSYNTCAVGRKGTLCGTCAKGYKQNFVGKDCIPKGKTCKEGAFAIYFVVYTVLYTFAFIVITNMKDKIVKVRAFLFKRSPTTQIKDEDAENENFSNAAFIQITILFYQVAGLLQIEFHGSDIENGSSSNEGVRGRITDVFNFRFFIYQQVCPSDELTLPQKEMILCGMKLSTLLILLLLLFVCKVIEHLLRYCSTRSSMVEAPGPSSQATELMPCKSDSCCANETSDSFEEEVPSPSFSCMLKFTFIKLLKLYYTPVTKSALKMVHCVSVYGKSHLYVYGDHVCYSSWQIAIVFIIIPSILLFPICFQLSLRLLKDRCIASWQFIQAIACPIFAVVLYAAKRRHKFKRKEGGECRLSGVEEHFRRAVLEGEEILFKEVKGRSLGWQVVQLYRTFAVTLLNTFITNPVYRHLAYFVLLLGFVIHDRDRQPYKNEYLNHLQSLGSRCLILVLVCNVIPAVSYLVDVRTVPLIFKVVQILKIVELMVYVVLPVSLAVWKVKKFIDSKRKPENCVRR